MVNKSGFGRDLGYSKFSQACPRRQSLDDFLSGLAPCRTRGDMIFISSVKAINRIEMSRTSRDISPYISDQYKRCAYDVCYRGLSNAGAFQVSALGWAVEAATANCVYARNKAISNMKHEQAMATACLKYQAESKI